MARPGLHRLRCQGELRGQCAVDPHQDAFSEAGLDSCAALNQRPSSLQRSALVLAPFRLPGSGMPMPSPHASRLAPSESPKSPCSAAPALHAALGLAADDTPAGRLLSCTRAWQLSLASAQHSVLQLRNEVAARLQTIRAPAAALNCCCQSCCSSMRMLSVMLLFHEGANARFVGGSLFILGTDASYAAQDYGAEQNLCCDARRWRFRLQRGSLTSTYGSLATGRRSG